jgi:DNA-directed RNA polymerase specialized sigma24 family protein
MSHNEIAAAVGLKSGSIRPLLFRARRRMAEVLQGKGLVP